MVTPKPGEKCMHHYAVIGAKIPRQNRLIMTKAKIDDAAANQLVANLGLKAFPVERWTSLQQRENGADGET